MSDSALFMSEVAKGISRGLMNGMAIQLKRKEMEEEKERKDRELDFKEKMFQYDSLFKQMKLGRELVELESQQQKTLSEIEIKRGKLELDQLRFEWQKAKQAEELAQGKEKEAARQRIEELEYELKKKGILVDMYKAKADFKIKQEGLKEEKRANKVKEERQRQKDAWDKEKFESLLDWKKEDAEAERAHRERLARLKGRGKSTDKLHKDVQFATRTLRADNVYKKVNQAMLSIENVIKQIKLAMQGVQVSDRQIGALMAKAIESTWRLTDQDVLRYVGSVDYVRRIQSFLRRAWNGKRLTVEYKELYKSLQATKTVSSRIRLRLVAQHARGVSRRNGVPLKTAVYLMGFDLPTRKKGKKRSRKEGDIVTDRKGGKWQVFKKKDGTLGVRLLKKGKK